MCTFAGEELKGDSIDRDITGAAGIMLPHPLDYYSRLLDLPGERDNSLHSEGRTVVFEQSDGSAVCQKDARGCRANCDPRAHCVGCFRAS